MAELNPTISDPSATTEVAPAAPPLSHGQKAAAALAQQTETTTGAVVAEPELSPLLAQIKELGFENVKDEKEALERLVAAHKQLKNEFGSTLQATLAELRASQPTTTAPVPTQDAKTGKWNWAPPAVDPQLLALYRTADGWKPETPAEVRQAAEARQRYFDSFATKFVSDPAAAIEPLLEDKFNQYFEQRFGQMAAEQQQATFQQKLFSDNPWLFEADPHSGKPNTTALSAEGKLIDQYMQEAQARGADYELAWEFAVSKHSAAKAAQAAKQTTTAQTAAETNEQKKRELLARASGSPNRTGSLPNGSDSRSSQRNRNLRPGERFAQIAKRDGLALS